MEYLETKERLENTLVVLIVQNEFVFRFNRGTINYKQNVFSDTNRLIFKRLRHLNSTKVSGFRKPAVSEKIGFISSFFLQFAIENFLNNIF